MAGDVCADISTHIQDKPMEDYTVPCNVTSRDDLIKGVTPPGVSTTGKKLFSEPPAIKDGVCNNGMPDTYLDRLVWSICYLTSQDMYVVIDHHLDYSQRDNTSMFCSILAQCTHPHRPAAAQLDPARGQLQDPRQPSRRAQLLA